MAIDTLYKYVSAERALTCLPEVGDGALRATQPAALNDPFECGIEWRFRDIDVNAVNKQHAKVLTGIHSASPVNDTDVKNAREMHGSLYLRELLSRQLSHRFGIVSFASDPRHPLMWSHYTVDGSGFVVGYDLEELEHLVEVKCLRPVVYSKCLARIFGFPVVSDHENILKLMSLKSDHWSYEQEWRQIVELKQTIGTGIKDPHGQPINLLRIPNSAVRVIYYTERTKSKDVQQIESRLKSPNNRYGAKSLTKLVLSETQYAYVDAKA